MSDERHTCPCCGRRTFADPPGSFDICEVCGWEDDRVQLLDPSYRGGANGGSLLEWQVQHQKFEASEEGSWGDTRKLDVECPRDPEWRPLREDDLGRGRAPRDLTPQEYESTEAWYYWKRPAT